MGMHISGFAEYRDGTEWTYIDDLPFIIRASLYYRLFGKGNPKGRGEPVAPERGIPEDASDDGREAYDFSTLDRGYHISFGESWMTLDEFPEADREDHEGTDTDWGEVLEMLAPYEREYGTENVRLVVWFTN